jgi:hypothetical protein
MLESVRSFGRDSNDRTPLGYTKTSLKKIINGVNASIATSDMDGHFSNAQ